MDPRKLFGPDIESVCIIHGILSQLLSSDDNMRRFGQILNDFQRTKDEAIAINSTCALLHASNSKTQLYVRRFIFTQNMIRTLQEQTAYYVEVNKQVNSQNILHLTTIDNLTNQIKELKVKLYDSTNSELSKMQRTLERIESKLQTNRTTDFHSPVRGGRDGVGRDGGRDVGRDGGRDGGRDVGRDGGRDVGRDVICRDGGRDVGRRRSREPILDDYPLPKRTMDPEDWRAKRRRY